MMNYQHRFMSSDAVLISHLPSRQLGKSVFADMVQQLTQPPVQILQKATVDNEMWYTVKLNMLTSDWTRQQDQSMWYEHSPVNNQFIGTFDIKEQLYTMLALKWK
jgi:hypothetical protein